MVTTVDVDGTPRGFTANSFTSVSLNPPLVLVGIAKSASSCAVFERCLDFAVNVLAGDQVAVSTLFATKSHDRFAQASWRPGVQGSPIFDGVAASFQCRRFDWMEAGDHVLMIGEVLAFDHAPQVPLAYCRGAYVDLALDLDPLSRRLDACG